MVYKKLLERLLAIVFLSSVLPLWAEDIPTPKLDVPELTDDHAIFNDIVAKVVQGNGVDYALLKDELRSELHRYHAQLAKAPWYENKEKRMALLINAYNAFTLILVVDRLPENRREWQEWSIKDLGGWLTNVWKKYRFELSGKWLTLDQIEHDYLRPMGDARIHFAVNCASRSCPALRSEAFQADQLDAQLEESAKYFATSLEHVRLEKGNVVVNPILSWFADDFGKASGVRAFLKKRVPGKVQAALEAGKPIKYFDYNWKLNLP